MRWNSIPPHPASSVNYTTSCNTQSSAPEDRRNYCPKHVELIGIINKPLLLHLVGCLYYCTTIRTVVMADLVLKIVVLLIFGFREQHSKKALEMRSFISQTRDN